MRMRAAAILVLLTLGGPSITGIVCDLTCDRHAPHGVAASPSEDCHGRETDESGPAMTRSAVVLCHDSAVSVAAIAATTKPLFAHPAVVHLTSALSFAALPRTLACSIARFRLPDILPTPPPLRI